MKRSLAFIFTILIITACSDSSLDTTTSVENKSIENEISIADLKPNKAQKSKQGIENELIITDIKSNNESSISLMSDGSRIYFGEKEDLIVIREKIELDELQQLNWEGPFQVPSQKIVLSNYQLFLVEVPGYAAQTFNVQDIDYRGTVLLPPNSVGTADVPNPVGWNRVYGDGSRELNITVSQSGRNFRVSTYTLNVHSTVIGQQVGIEFPNQLTTGFNYTYYYIELP